MVRHKGIRAMLLVEDRRTERFVREVLLLMGFHRHDIRIKPYPVGKGSAKEWINREYPTEVSALRSKNFQSNLALIVGTEADELTVNRRTQQLSDKLQESNLAARESAERIVLLIPKWNIETWLLYFQGDIRDEETDYKNDLKDPDFKHLARLCFQEFQKFKLDQSLGTQPSLSIAYQEAQRLD